MAKKYDLSELTFLIIDDNSYMRSIIKTLLKGFSVRRILEAADAVEGFEEFQKTHIDIIIIDYVLDTLDGIEFVQLVRNAKDSPNSHVPMIMLTAHSERSQVERARDAGVTEFLCKPICASDLYARIISVIERPRSFVRSKTFFGPDRRRRNDTVTGDEERRKEAAES